jgi:hypothetical protein
MFHEPLAIITKKLSHCFAALVSINVADRRRPIASFEISVLVAALEIIGGACEVCPCRSNLLCSALPADIGFSFKA